MKGLFALYHDYNFEARAPELIEALRLLGVDDLSMVTYEKPSHLNDVKVHVSPKGSLKYFYFVRDSIKYINSEKPNVVLLHDNASAPILAYLVKKKYKGIIIYDSSELYIDRFKAKSLKLLLAKIRPYCERKYLKYADIVIAANDERAEIMREFFALKEKPLVLNNIHKIEDAFDEEQCRIKFKNCLLPQTFIIAYGGGVFHERRTVELAKAVIELGEKYSLIIAGPGDDDEIEVLNKVIENNDLKNVFYVGKLPRKQWRFITTVANCSASIFPQDTPNNKYCASGKFYESALEGTPVLATENPPFKNACSEYGFGVTSEDLKNGILTLQSNYDYYKRNAVLFSKTYDYRGRINRLVEQIQIRLKVKQDD